MFYSVKFREIFFITCIGHDTYLNNIFNINHKLQISQLANQFVVIWGLGAGHYLGGQRVNLCYYIMVI